MKNLFPIAIACAAALTAADRVKTADGILEGTVNSDSSVRIFRGIPFAAAPVGNLRWQAPHPVQHWSGVRKADEFGGYCVQGQVFSDILPRSKEMSEDCLYLTVWAPAKPAAAHLPVYVWFYGGGFAAGSGDEPRYDGESFAKHGIVVVNVNYRLGIFGFFSHPELSKESGHNASGNYGLLDQVAALQWVRKNIAAFGGDPKKVTIGGESAGSLSVSALMASPLSRDLFQQAVGESGAFFGAVGGRGMASLAESEKQGVKFATAIGAKSLAELRAKSSADLLKDATKNSAGFWPNVDGYFLPTDVQTIFAEGKQSQIPLLAGWNADEVRMMVMMAKEKPNAKTFPEHLRQQFKDNADGALKVYAASNDEEALRSAGDLASDSFIVFGTWKWLEMQTKTGKPVYRFEFDRTVPIPDAMKSMAPGVKSFGSAHASELEYVFKTLPSKKADWQPDDQKVAETMNDYWANFIKTGDPNGAGLAEWPNFTKTHEVMHIDTDSKALPETHRDRYEFLDSIQSAAGSK